MQSFLVILLVLAIIATVVALVRGIILFLKTNHDNIRAGGEGPSESGLRQNKMMQARVLFQALAVIIIVLILLLRASH